MPTGNMDVKLNPYSNPPGHLLPSTRLTKGDLPRADRGAGVRNNRKIASGVLRREEKFPDRSYSIQPPERTKSG